MFKEKGTRLYLFLLIVSTSILILSGIKPKEGYGIWFLEVLPGIVPILVAIFTFRKFRLTTLSYVIIAILAVLTFIGGHYTYSKVPIFNWIKDYFDFERNHYDRFGHFMKGLIVILIREVLIRTSPLSKGKWLAFISLSITLAIGAMYELVEWSSTMVSKGNGTTNDFLGMQGDKWDAQWDMMFLLVGAILSLLIFRKLHNKLLERQ